MSRSSEEDAGAFRSHTRKVAAQKFNEVIRSNTRVWDDKPMSDDERAYSDDAIRRAAQEFHQATYEPWPDR
jgi:hypothetical protein